MKIHSKKALILSIVLCFIFCQKAFANSGPTFWQGYSSAQVLSVDKNCPIEIEGEKLTFDLRKGSQGSYTVNGQVTASYEMANPTDRDLSVHMAFPYVGSLRDFSPEDVAITCDETEVAYDLYIGDTVENRGSDVHQKEDANLAFEDILSTITSEPYKSDLFSYDEAGKLYTIVVKPTTEERINFAVDFILDKERSRVLTSGFNRYEQSGRAVRFAARCYEQETLDIFVLGEDIDFNFKAYSDGELKKETDKLTFEVSSREVEFKSYILNRMREFEKEINVHIDEIQLYNLYARALDRIFGEVEGYCSLEELYGLIAHERILTLLYTVPFPANSKRNVTVSYKTSGTMDRRKTIAPLYTFNYILNPARNWKSFKNLEVEIITPEEAPYIIESSLELIKNGDRHYTASLENLPQEDLIFTIYEKEEISYLDRIKGFFASNSNLLFRLFAVLGPSAIGVLLGKLIYKLYQAYKQRKQSKRK